MRRANEPVKLFAVRNDRIYFSYLHIFINTNCFRGKIKIGVFYHPSHLKGTNTPMQFVCLISSIIAY